MPLPSEQHDGEITEMAGVVEMAGIVEMAAVVEMAGVVEGVVEIGGVVEMADTDCGHRFRNRTYIITHRMQFIRLNFYNHKNTL